jgi:beta-glucanase (GH16 family)
MISFVSVCRIVCAGVFFALTFSSVAARADSLTTSPLPAGLVLWLDASDTDSIKTDADGKVILWRDRSGQSHDVTPGEEASTRPQLVPNALNNRPVIRFSGGQILRCRTPLRISPGAATVIVVSRRTMSQSGGNAWQRLFSSQPDARQGDHLSPNFVLTGDSQGLPSAYATVITETEQSNVPIGPLGIGGGADGGSNGLRGDIAEVLVYNRAFLAQGDRLLVLEYLRAKWKAAIPQSLMDWTRVGSLGPTPKHLRADLPLSDQNKRGHWRLDKQLSDEFGTALTPERWHLSPTGPGDWAGRQPALYLPSNVTVNHGMLQIAFRKGDVPEMKSYPGQGYEGYTSGSVRTTQRTGYGYYEVCAKPMNSAGSSAFWFTDTGVSDNATEIDVFEIGGKTRYFNRKYNMNAHVWATPQEKRHWSVGGVWDSPWNLADDFHVYGFDWNKDYLTWYVDGVAVRRAKNTNWFLPMYLYFDSEAMWDWFGKVDDADLPSFFQVKYLRVWRQGPLRSVSNVRTSAVSRPFVHGL